MATVTETVKETLVGITIEPELSDEIRATFERYSVQDEVTGESYMTEKEFVNAIAPVNEDYVGFTIYFMANFQKLEDFMAFRSKADWVWSLAQD